MNYVIIVILIAFSALFSGLTLGLMGLSTQDLKRKRSLGDKDAGKVYPVRKKGNLLLCTLLVGNVAINSTLSIFLGSIASGFVAGLIATSLIVVFGEIVPQAVFSRFALYFGAKTTWLVRIFIFAFYPVCWPIAKILDKALGDELGTIYSKQELMKIIEEHEDIEESDVDADEERIIKGALTYSDKIAKDVMTPRSVVTLIDASQKVNDDLLNMVSGSGHTRFPVYEGEIDNIVGVLYSIELLKSKNWNKKVGAVVSKDVYFVEENERLDDIFNAFLKKRKHMFVVANEFKEIVGVITLEDVLEEIIKKEIVDEGDKYVDMRDALKKQPKEIGENI